MRKVVQNGQNVTGWVLTLVDNCCLIRTLLVYLDFDEIRRNAREQGVELSQIMIVYERLNDSQFETLNSNGLVVTDLGEGNAIGRFKADGEVLFPEVATRVLYLGA